MEAEQIFDSETILNQLPTPKTHIVNLFVHLIQLLGTAPE